MKKKSLHLISAILVGAIIIAATSYGVWKMNKDIDNAVVNVEQNGNNAQGIDTSDWQKYRNEEYGFEVKYPQDWELIKLPDPKSGFLLEPQSGNEKIYLSKTRNYDNLEIIDLIDTFNDTSRFWPQEFPYKNTIINDKESVVFEYIKEGEQESKEIFIKLDGYVFESSYLYEEKDENAEKIFNQIVKEIQFIGSLN